MDMARLETPRISMYRGNGDGTFEPEVTYSGGGGQYGPTALIVHDFNADGALDIGSPAGCSPDTDLDDYVGFSILLNRMCAAPPPCPADIVPPPDGDGQVSIADITSVLAAFNIPCNDCPQDIVPPPDGDGQVSIADITAVLAAFGPCPQPSGACCFPAGDCGILTQVNCNAQGGTWVGSPLCGPSSCPQPEFACCLPNGGGCQEMTEEDCTAAYGWWQDGEDCVGFSCPPAPTGACCVDDGMTAQCLDDLTHYECEVDFADLNGQWQGAGSTCAGVTCDPPRAAPPAPPRFAPPPELKELVGPPAPSERPRGGER
jgi:hypothetical protein